MAAEVSDGLVTCFVAQSVAAAVINEASPAWDRYWSRLRREETPAGRVRPSQKRRCLASDVVVANVWSQSGQRMRCRQSACMRLCRQRFENCVYAL